MLIAYKKWTLNTDMDQTKLDTAQHIQFVCLVRIVRYEQRHT